MVNQPPGQTLVQVVPRQYLAPGPLGTVGNLRFTPRQGGTAPAGSPGAVANMLRSWAGLQFALSDASAPARRRREILIEVRANSRSIGDLLGCLTAPSNDARALAAIAQGLARLGWMSRGDLAALRGVREALITYMGELSYTDLVALRHGALGQAGVRKAVLDQVSSGLREQAAHVLQQIQAAFRQRSAQEVVQNPLREIARLLAVSSPDAQELEIPLDKLRSGLAMLDSSGTQGRSPIDRMLDTYLQSLPRDQFEALLTQIHAEALDAANEALLRKWEAGKMQAAMEEQKGDPSLPEKEQWVIKRQSNLEDYPPLSTLALLRAALEREICSRTQPAMLRLELALMPAVSLGKRGVASRVLLDMNALLDQILRSYRTLPDVMACSVSKQLKDSLNLFRDTRRNREGALNAASLRELDDITFVNLRRATRLHALGLTLDLEAAKRTAMERVEPLRRQFNELMSAVFWSLSRGPLDMPVLMRRLQDLSDVGLDYIQQLEGVGHFDEGRRALADRRSLFRGMCERAVEALFRERPAFLERDAMKCMGLLRELGGKYLTAASKLEGAIALGGYEQSGRTVKEQLAVAYYLSIGMSEALYEQLMAMAEDSPPDMLGGLYKSLLSRKEAEPGGRLPPGTFYPGLRELYGLVHDLTTNEVVLLAADTARAKMVPELEALVPVAVPLALEQASPANGSDRGATADQRLYAQELERAGVLLSVRGSGSHEQPVRFMWSGASLLEDRRHALECAWDALAQVAGPRAGALTCLMCHADTHAAVSRGLRQMGLDSPFTLRDGTVVHVVGAGPLLFDVAKTESGDFLVGTTVRFVDMAVVPGTLPDGAKAIITLDPRASWAEVQYVLHVSADLRAAKAIGLPRFRHHFEFVSHTAIVPA